MEAKPITEIIPKILGTSAHAPLQTDRSTLPKPVAALRYANKLLNASPEWKRHWIRVRLELDHYHPDVAILENAIWDFCVGFAQKPDCGTRLVLWGTNGNGKTKCCRVVRRWVNEKAIDMPLVMKDEGAALCDCLMVNWPDRVNRLKGGNWDLEDMMNCDLLIVDDFGAEHDPSKMALEKIYLVLERREFKWTIITTNIHPNNWEERFERRVSDRLFRNSKHVDLSNLPSYSVPQ